MCIHHPVRPLRCGLWRTSKRASKSFRKGKNLICILSYYHAAYLKCSQELLEICKYIYIYTINTRI